MDQEMLEKFRAWFDEYVAKFYGNDEYVNANLEMKEEHSRRTCEEMKYLAKEIGLDADQRRVAELIALFHDIGRFEQFVRYRTYNDPRSVDHCLLGVEVMRQTDVLKAVPEKEKQLVEKAIEYHGLKELPADLDGEARLFSRLIRDADKLDALYIVTECYERYRDNRDQFKLEVELPDEPGYSPGVVNGILRGERIDHSGLRTWNDMKLCQIAWVYDVNFPATLRRIKQRRFLERIFDCLPQTEDIDRVKDKIFEYVDSRVKQRTNRN